MGRVWISFPDHYLGEKVMPGKGERGGFGNEIRARRRNVALISVYVFIYIGTQRQSLPYYRTTFSVRAGPARQTYAVHRPFLLSILTFQKFYKSAQTQLPPRLPTDLCAKVETTSHRTSILAAHSLQGITQSSWTAEKYPTVCTWVFVCY